MVLYSKDGADTKEKYRVFTNKSIEEIEAEGYKPCGACHPNENKQ